MVALISIGYYLAKLLQSLYSTTDSGNLVIKAAHTSHEMPIQLILSLTSYNSKVRDGSSHPSSPDGHWVGRGTQGCKEGAKSGGYSRGGQ